MTEEACSLGHMPKSKWEFDTSVTEVFDDMLIRSIPQYMVMRKAVLDVAKDYIQPQTAIVDLGCSRGEALTPFVSFYSSTNTCIGIEISDPMIQAAQKRFAHNAQVRKMDLRESYPEEMASVTLSVLTLQFTPIEYRQRIVREVFKHTVSGGIFLLIEKILGANAEINATLVKNYYRLKTDNGYTTEEIERKRLSLEGVLVPVTAKWNEELLHIAGFQYIDCFWRWMNFAGWIAVKE
jgi:tRNA (cmo5U34)-methyltransferase